MFLFFMLYHLMLSGNFYGLKIGMGFFGGLNVRPGFLGLCLKPQGFFGVLTFAPIQSSLSLKIRSIPLGNYHFTLHSFLVSVYVYIYSFPSKYLP